MPITNLPGVIPAVPLVDQYTVTVGQSVVLAASFAGPFQVINASTAATIWLSDNTNVSDGHGIPLYPGTGMVWTGSQKKEEKKQEKG